MLSEAEQKVLDTLENNNPLGFSFAPHGSGEWQLANRLLEKGFITENTRKRRASLDELAFKITPAGREALGDG